MSARTTARLAAALLLVATVAGCDDQVKHVPWFATMFRQPSVETYEREMPDPPEGAVYVGEPEHLDLLAADSLLTNPLTGTPAEIERGATLFHTYCLPCHGETGDGKGPVVGPNRLPPLPTMNLLSDRAKNELSDGYIWGMIANGRGVMPSYKRVPIDDRWYLVVYVRELQRRSEAGEAAGRTTGE
jgi:mono/diheme cytochrome c family protein